MDTQLYDVYLTGKLADGLTIDTASQRLAALFKSTPAAMAGMLSGKPQLLKRGIDKATALKYRDTLQKAGVEVAFKTVATAPTIAASTATATGASSASSASLQLAPVGTELLREDERRVYAAAAIDTTHLSVAALSPFPPQHKDDDATIPDTSYLSLAPAGDLLSAAEREQPQATAPDIGDLSLAPAGTSIETLSIARPAVNPDVSQLTLAPTGTELLTEAQRHQPSAVAPDTSHIQLVDR